MNPAYYWGYDAYCEGKKLSRCPKHLSDEDKVNWREGWQNAKRISETPIPPINYDLIIHHEQEMLQTIPEGRHDRWLCELIEGLEYNKLNLTQLQQKLLEQLYLRLDILTK